MPDCDFNLVSYFLGAFTVFAIIAIALCWSSTRISRGDYTQCRGLDRLHK